MPLSPRIFRQGSHTVGPALLLALGALALPAPGQAPKKGPEKASHASPKKSVPQPLLEQIYRLIWPMGKFDADLAKAVAKSTQRGGVPQIVRLYLVRTDSSTPTASEWKSARGALDPVFCDSDSLLFYRRGTELWRQKVAFDGNSATESGPPERVADTAVRHLFACGADAAKRIVLWASDSEGRLRWLAATGQTLAWQDPPPAFGDQSTEDLIASLVVLRSIRPDGAAALVSDGLLIGQRNGSPRYVILAPSQKFFGYPTWMGNRELLLVSGGAGQ